MTLNYRLLIKPSLLVRFCVSALAILAGLPAHAQLLRIIHTNDLHAYFERSEHPAMGGYAAVKATIDRLRAESQAQGIETLVLDAGDFSEGSEFYLAGNGEMAWRAMDTMGYDAVTIGNHDWLMGPRDLDGLVGKVRPSFAFLGANFYHDPSQENLDRYMKPSVELVRAGARIAILGLTTSDFVFNWRVDEGFVTKPVAEAKKRIPELKSRNDFVIALTHIGIKGDKKLVKKTEGLDLVVGGHSHTVLHEPVYVQDKSKKSVPIVQTGEHGEHVGDLLIDLVPGKPLQVLRYELVPIRADGPKDPMMAALVREARHQLENQYGRDWLGEIVGHAAVPLRRQHSMAPTPWSKLAADAIREAGNADMALDIPAFSGRGQFPGPITREQIFALYPRMFDFKDRFGWTVWTTDIRGGLLEAALKESIKFKVAYTTSGVTYDVKEKLGLLWVTNVRVGGKKIDPHKLYRVALPEGIARGALEIHESLKYIFKNAHNTETPIWFAIEDKIRRIGVVK